MDVGTWRCYIRQMATAFKLDEFVRAPALERARAVEQGLPAKALRDLIADPDITIADLSRVIAPRRTLERRLKERGRLNARESDRLGAFVTILDTVTTMFGSRGEAMEWLRRPKRQFDGDSPIDMMATNAGAQAIDELLIRARFGMLA